MLNMTEEINIARDKSDTYVLGKIDNSDDLEKVVLS